MWVRRQTTRSNMVVALLLAVLFLSLVPSAAQADRLESPELLISHNSVLAAKSTTTATNNPSPTVDTTQPPTAIPSPTVGVTQPPTPVPSPTVGVTQQPTSDPSPTVGATQPPTPVPSPSDTVPASSPTPQPTSTQAPTATSTPPPTGKPTATATNTLAPTSTPVSTNTPTLTLAPVPTATLMPGPTSLPTVTRTLTSVPTLRPILMTPSPTGSSATATTQPAGNQPTSIPTSEVGTATPTDLPLAGGNSQGGTGDSAATGDAAIPRVGRVQTGLINQVLSQIALNPGTIVFIAALVGIIAAVCAYLVQKRLSV